MTGSNLQWTTMAERMGLKALPWVARGDHRNVAPRLGLGLGLTLTLTLTTLQEDYNAKLSTNLVTIIKVKILTRLWRAESGDRLS